MARKDNRFLKVYAESRMMSGNEIWVDSQTGVNYLYHQSGYGGGLTPLLDEQGKPIVTPKFELDTLIYNSR